MDQPMDASTTSLRDLMAQSATILLGRPPRSDQDQRQAMRTWFEAANALSPAFQEPFVVSDEFVEYLYPSAAPAASASVSSAFVDVPRVQRLNLGLTTDNDDDDNDDDDNDDDDNDDDDDDKGPILSRFAFPAASTSASATAITTAAAAATTSNTGHTADDPWPVKGLQTQAQFNAQRIAYAERHPEDQRAQNAASLARRQDARRTESRQRNTQVKKEKKKAKKEARTAEIARRNTERS